MSASEKQQIIDTVGKGSHDIKAPATRLYEDPYQLWAAKGVDAARGLEDRMRVNHSEFHVHLAHNEGCIQAELDELSAKSAPAVAAELKEWLTYILHEKTSEKMYSNGIRDEGRPGLTLLDFLEHDFAKAARLTMAEVLALRIYTTPIFKYINNPLRDDDRYDNLRAVPLAATTYFAAQGIKKLRALNIAAGPALQRRDSLSPPVTLRRGMRNMRVADDFRRDDGTELAFMSTTTDVDVAVRYSLSQTSLLLKIRAPNFMSTGACLKWISAFPSEAEVLYPPLTYMFPTGKADAVAVTEPRSGRVFIDSSTSLLWRLSLTCLERRS